MDIDEKQLEVARENAKKRQLSNVTFIKGNVYELPFKDSTFDAVLAHTLLIHLNDQLGVLKIFHRLLKRGGVVGISDDDWGTHIESPETSFTGKSIKLMAKVIKHNGGNPYYSRHLRSLMIKAGFTRNEGHAIASEYYGTLKETQRIVSVVNRILSDPDYGNGLGYTG